MQARIYSPTKSAMQSGKGKSGSNSDTWLLEYEPRNRRNIEPLMGYTSSSDMNSQVKLKFSSLEAAKTYCEKNDLTYHIQHQQKPRRQKMAYADNFSNTRALPWTH